MAKQKELEHCYACTGEGQEDNCGEIETHKRILAEIAAAEVAAFSYSDWYHASYEQRGARVAKAILLARVLTDAERVEWRYEVMPSLMPKR